MQFVNGVNCIIYLFTQKIINKCAIDIAVVCYVANVVQMGPTPIWHSKYVVLGVVVARQPVALQGWVQFPDFHPIILTFSEIFCIIFIEKVRKRKIKLTSAQPMPCTRLGNLENLYQGDTLRLQYPVGMGISYPGAQTSTDEVS